MVENDKSIKCTKFRKIDQNVDYVSMWCGRLIMGTIIRHVFNNIFQTKHLSAVNFVMGYGKNMSFLVIPKSPEVWKKVEKIGWAPLN